MYKKILISAAIISIILTLGMVKANKKTENYEMFFRWGTSKNINSPKEVEKALKYFGDVDLKKLNQLQVSKGKYINYYEPFYNYKNHTFQTIENIFKARQKVDDESLSKDIDKLILNLYRKTETQFLVHSVITSKTEYKEMFNRINNILININSSYPRVDYNENFILIYTPLENHLYVFDNKTLENIFNFHINEGVESRNSLTNALLYNNSKILYTTKNYINNKCELYQLDIITKENKLLYKFDQNFGLLAYENGIIYVRKSKWSETDKGKKDYNLYSLNLNDYKFKRIIEFPERVHILDIKNNWLLYKSDDITLHGINMNSNKKTLIYKFKDSEFISKAKFKDNKTILAQISYDSSSGIKRKILTIDKKGKITLIDNNYDHLLVDEISNGYVYNTISRKTYFKIIK